MALLFQIHYFSAVYRAVLLNLPEKQYAYRRYHSTETAVIDVLSDVYEAADSGQVTLLGMLDVVDHQILFDRLEHAF